MTHTERIMQTLRSAGRALPAVAVGRIAHLPPTVVHAVLLELKMSGRVEREMVLDGGRVVGIWVLR